MSQVMSPTAAALPASDGDRPPEHDRGQHDNHCERTLLAIFRSLRERGIPIWVIDGYGSGSFDPVDVDVLVPRASLPQQIPHAVYQTCRQLGAGLISWDRDDQFVLACAGAHAPAAEDSAQPPAFLRIHLRPDYRRVGRYFYDGDEVLAEQQQHAGRRTDDGEAFATPSTPREFTCYLIEKIAKCCLAPVHGPALSAAFARDPDGCQREIDRFWSGADAALLGAAARSGNWEIVCRAQDELRAELRRAAFVRRPFWTVGYKLSKGLRRLAELLRPSTGLHVVLLGPDGVGKSTVVEALQRELAPAFCGIQYQTFAPGLLPRKIDPATSGVGQPHGKKPRSWPASIVKGLWWVVYYSIGYYVTTRPAIARGGLVLNHRYCADVLVDQRRYRYAGPQWLLKLAWRVARKPDLVFLLDAPPEVVQARKQEVAFEETLRQRDAYRQLVEPMPNGHVVDAAQPVDRVVRDVERAILAFLAERTKRRLGLLGDAS